MLLNIVWTLIDNDVSSKWSKCGLMGHISLWIGVQTMLKHIQFVKFLLPPRRDTLLVTE